MSYSVVTYHAVRASCYTVMVHAVVSFSDSSCRTVLVHVVRLQRCVVEAGKLMGGGLGQEGGEDYCLSFYGHMYDCH